MQTVMQEMVFELREFLSENVYTCFDIHSIKLVFEKSTVSIFIKFDSVKLLFDKTKIDIRQCGTGIRRELT